MDIHRTMETNFGTGCTGGVTISYSARIYQLLKTNFILEVSECIIIRKHAYVFLEFFKASKGHICKIRGVCWFNIKATEDCILTV